MPKKSNAQIRRALKRAEERGEEYVPPVPEEKEDNKGQKEQKTVENDKDTKERPEKESSGADSKLVDVAVKLKKELEDIQNDEGLRAKERRSNKRKAEAIAAEAAGITVEEMQKWYEENLEMLDPMAAKMASDKPKGGGKESGSHKPNPYIVFIGQLAYTTTKDAIFEHIKKELGSEHKITPETVKIRLLTDPKTKKSRGMAFVELSDPETMYACLKLHHTMLDERRLNVERSAGGSKSKRQSKIKEFREEQDKYISNVVESILKEYMKTGELKEGELDEGCILLCKRYNAALVEIALKQYIEKNGRTMDNPSAYFTFVLTKLATEGVWDQDGDKDKGKSKDNKKDTKFPAKKKPKTSVSSQSAFKGVDFGMSEKATQKEGNHSMSDIFPTLSGGRRGRGRGYM